MRWMAGWALLSHINAALFPGPESSLGSVLSACQTVWCWPRPREAEPLTSPSGRPGWRRQSPLGLAPKWGLTLWESPCPNWQGIWGARKRVPQQSPMATGQNPAAEKTFHRLVGKRLDCMTTHTYAHTRFDSVFSHLRLSKSAELFTYCSFHSSLMDNTFWCSEGLEFHSGGAPVCEISLSRHKVENLA